MGLEKSYEILCKAFDHEAKAILEVQTIALFSMNNNVVILKIHAILLLWEFGIEKEAFCHI